MKERMELRKVIALAAMLLALNGAFACLAFAKGLAYIAYEPLKELRDVARWGQWFFAFIILVIALNEIRLWERKNRALTSSGKADEHYAMAYVTLVSVALLGLVSAAALGTGMTLSELASKNDAHATDIAKLGAMLRANRGQR